jgi:hypothetical protein
MHDMFCVALGVCVMYCPGAHRVAYARHHVASVAPVSALNVSAGQGVRPTPELQ